MLAVMKYPMERRAMPQSEGVNKTVVRQANWQKVGGASPLWRRSRHNGLQRLTEAVSKQLAKQVCLR